MGCGASRLDDNGVVFPAKARPLFLVRLEEFKRKRSPKALMTKDTTPSKKELLLHDREDEENVSTHQQPLFISKGGGKDLPSQDEAGSCVTSEGSKGGSPEREGDDGNGQKTLMENNEGEEKQGRIINNGVPLAKDEAKVEKNILDGDVKNDHENDEDEEEDDDDDDDDGRMLRHQHHDDGDEVFPGSPSFRVYFNGNINDNNNEDLDDHLTDMSPIHDDSAPSELLMAKEVKKGKKRRSFKRVLPTGRQAKNLFNVRACMSSTHSSHGRAGLLTAKPHA
ncbi:hypothetical protein ACH5RR_025275 [Cinchona calisaya]|uniref:Uncharacterized protein n=1 Tax=Cinchona calisaya TaxID=153742 RepID=A0ABD2Z098_9GENT